MEKDPDDDLVGQTLIRIRVREIRSYCSDLLDQYDNPKPASEESVLEIPVDEALKRGQT